jgi:sulfane dehydrogenase subunit SoxC
VPLSAVLEMVGVQKGATWMVAEGTGAKKHSADIPLAKALNDPSPAMLAYGQNGEPVRPEQGYPLRLITPGFEGMRNVKGLQRIKITDRPYWTYYENVAYNNLKTDGKARNFQYEMEPSSIITFPSGEQKLPGPGFYEIRGLAWSGGGSVHRVEVSTNGGKTWKDAELQLPIHRIAFTAFRLPWKWDGQETVITSRCTDENGDIQPSLPEFSKIWNVPPDYWQKSNNRVQHFNAWVPWKIYPDGRVKDWMWDPSNNVAG